MPMSARANSLTKIKYQIPIHERVLIEVEKKRENREKIKRNLDMEEMKECSFKPKLLDYSVLPRYPKVGT